jgi:hypothetical protein
MLAVPFENEACSQEVTSDERPCQESPENEATPGEGHVTAQVVIHR